MARVTHHCTLAWHYPIDGGPRTGAWICTCSDHGLAPTMSLAAQSFAEHYADVTREREETSCSTTA